MDKTGNLNLSMNPLDESLKRMDGYEVTRGPQTNPQANGSGIPNFQEGIFTYKGNRQTPWKSEQTHSYSHPKEYVGRILNGSIVHTGGNTEMAMTTHHTLERPQMPPGTIRGPNFIQPQYVPNDDPALDELHAVAHVIWPSLPALLEACRGYHLHSPDGWITTAGFMTAAKKAGLELSRAEYLALERALTKDVRGRINYLQMEQLVVAIAAGDGAAAQ